MQAGETGTKAEESAIEREDANSLRQITLRMGLSAGRARCNKRVLAYPLLTSRCNSCASSSSSPNTFVETHPSHPAVPAGDNR